MDLQQLTEMSGYTFKTTFWQDFTIAEMFGENAVKDTFKRAFEEWKNDTVYIVDLCMVMNWKTWSHYQDRPHLAELYERLFYKVDAYCTTHLKGKNLEYFYKTTD